MEEKNRFFPVAIVAVLVLFIFTMLQLPQGALARKSKPGLDSQYYLREYYFNGNEYIGIAKCPKIEKDLTILCFVNPEKEAFKNNASLICRWMDTNGYQSYDISLTDDYHIKIWLEICAEDSRINHNVGLTLSNPARVASWQHIALVYDGKDIKAYYNGILDSDKIFSGQLISPKAPDLLLGAKENFVDFTKGNLFKGALREVYIFNRVLSEDEIKKLYEEGLGRIQGKE